jgi:hypothetical protein
MNCDMVMLKENIVIEYSKENAGMKDINRYGTYIRQILNKEQEKENGRQW